MHRTPATLQFIARAAARYFGTNLLSFAGKFSSANNVTDFHASYEKRFNYENHRESKMHQERLSANVNLIQGFGKLLNAQPNHSSVL